MKLLFASRYVDPINPRANHNIIKQARILQDQFDINVEILTWPSNDLWGGPLPERTPTLEPLKVSREGLNYSIIIAPDSWNEVAGGNVISDEAWQAAVQYGMNLLASHNPDIFHLHHRFGFWWLLESAQRLGIPTVYSNYDWGMACLRTVLVKAKGELCDGVVEPEKCAACIKTGRTRIAGKLNEALAETRIGQRILTKLAQSTVTREKFRANGAVNKPALWRATTNLKRVRSTITRLDHCITPSKFGKQFFQQFGIDDKKVTVIPWYHDPVVVEPSRIPCEQPFTLTFIGRVSPDKGVHQIFEALEKLDDIPALLLRVAGAIESEYCNSLKESYGVSVGKHQVQWLGWSKIDGLLRTTDVVLIPSIWMDNTPLTLIEAMAYHVPVIATAIPTITSILNGKGVGYLAEFNSVQSLAMAIKSAYFDKKLIRARVTKFPKINSQYEYGKELLEIYNKILKIKSKDVQ